MFTDAVFWQGVLCGAGTLAMVIFWLVLWACLRVSEAKTTGSCVPPRRPK